MNNKNSRYRLLFNKKTKEISLLFVFLLFIVVAAFFLSISSNHKINSIIKNSIPVPNAQIKTISLKTIFAIDHTWVDAIPVDKRIELIATGDVIPARVVNIQSVQKNDFTWSFEKTADVLRKADISFINLETPLFVDCPLINTGFTFCGKDKHIQGLLLAGVDVVSLANNHAGNYGREGIKKTVDLLTKNEILVTGTNGPTYKKVKNTTFAFLGYNDIGGQQEGISYADKEKIRKEINDAHKQADIVVVTFHWGVEYRDQPDERQKYLGHFAIDSGADLVIGNHPHWIQPIEFYKGKLITYAHGNFVFDQEWSRETKEGVIGRYIFYEKKLIDVQYLPVFIQDYGQPHFLQDGEKEKILENMKKQSIILSQEK